MCSGDVTAKELPRGGSIDDAQHRRARTHQRNVDREFRTPGDEFARAIQRIHEKKRGADVGHAPRGHLLLGNDGDVGEERAEAPQNDGLGGVVRRRDRGVVLLVFELEVAFEDAMSGVAGCKRGGDHEF